MKADKPSVTRPMRMILHPLFRTVALLAMIVYACAPFGASMAHANSTPHHGLIQTIGHGPDAVTALPMTMHDGNGKPCCPANSGQTEGGGCTAVACTSLPGALTTAFIADGSWRLVRDCFFNPQNKLPPHNLAPEPEPPRI